MKTFLITISIIAIIYFIVATIINKVNKHSEYGTTLHKPKWLLIIPLIVLVVTSFLTVIPAQNCGVVITPEGVKKESYKTGWHIIFPIYKVSLMDKTAQVYTCARKPKNQADNSDAIQTGTVWVPTIDGIKMGFDISASWKIDPKYAWWIYDNVSEQDGGNTGRFYWLEENVIKPKLKSALALTVAKYNPIEVYSNRRQNIQDEVFEKMKNEIKPYHLSLDQIDVREVYYNKEYETAINAKKLEEQRVLTLVEITKQKREEEIQAEINKNIAIKQAEGEAQALKIKGQSIVNNPKIVELEWISKWNGELPNYMMGSGQGVMLNFNNK